jgi:hypothetical protein
LPLFISLEEYVIDAGRIVPDIIPRAELQVPVGEKKRAHISFNMTLKKYFKD